MKNFVSKHQSTLFILGFITVGVVITLQTTWNNRDWLSRKIIDNGAAKDEEALAGKSKSELRSMLRSSM